MICPIVCGCPVRSKRISTPDSYSPPSPNVLCPVCNDIVDTEYRKDKTRCEICFCCCIPCGSSDPYLACSRCGHPLGTIESHRCKQCGIATTYNSRYCPKCGTRK